MDFEEKFGHLFPVDWEVSERICVEFCELTRYGLQAHILNLVLIKQGSQSRFD